MLLLGVLFRFLACLCLILKVNANTTGWSRFLAQSEAGVWKLFGKLFQLLVGTFLAMFLFSEVWVFGIVKLRAQHEHIKDPTLIKDVLLNPSTVTLGQALLIT